MRGPRSMRWGFAAPLLAAGCFSVPPYVPENAVSYTESAGGGALVAGDGFELRFADGPGFHFPDALRIEVGEVSHDVLGHDPAAGCFDEDGAGVLIAPTPRISAGGEASPVTNRLVPVLNGPAVVQVKLEWATSFGCDNTRTPGGTSTFTVFPEGRIARHDTVVDPISTPISPSPCACGAGGNGLFHVSTFWTLARERFSELRYGTNREQLPAQGAVVTNYAASCVGGDGYQVGVAWSDNLDVTIRGGGALVGFGRDLVQGDAMLRNFSFANSSTLLIGRDGCEAGLERAEAHADPSPLTIEGVAVTPSLVDGLYGGDGLAGPGLEIADGRAELTGQTEGSFAVWLRFPRAADAVRATLEGKTGPWYLPQRVDDRSWIVWFRDPLVGDQTITIEPI